MLNDGRERSWSAIDVALACASALTFLYGWIYYPIAQGHRGDFLAALSHRDVSSASYWNGKGLGYGPIFALYDLALRPFRDLTALRMMYALNLVLLALALVVLLRTFLPPPRSRRETLIALFLWTSFYPLVQLIRQDDIEITELFFLSLFLLYSTRRKPLRAGLSLGLAASVKLIPIFLVPYLLWRRQWKTISVALGTLASAIVLVAAIKHVGLDDFLVEWRSTAHAPWNNEWNNNQAVSGFFWRFFSRASFSNEIAAAYPRVLRPSWAQLATVVTSLVAVLSVAVVFIRRAAPWPGPTRDPRVEVTEIAITFTVLLLTLPHSHTHYFGLIVWVYFIALRSINRDQLPLGARTQWSFVLSYLLAGLLLPLRLADPLVRRCLPVSLIEVAKLFSLPFFGLVLVVLALFAVHRAQLRMNDLVDGDH